jgi:lycopene cyclase domain-containing protein
MYVPVAEKYTYLFLDIATILGPLILSFDKKVAFYKYFKPLALATAITSAVYIIWDEWFTQIGIWEFNNTYLLGLNIGSLPLEEYGFFTVVPYACIFIYMCLKIYFPHLKIPFRATWLLITLLSLSLSTIYIDNTYTFVTFFLLFTTLIATAWMIPTFLKRIWTHLFLAWVIAILPMAYVNGVLTSKPVLIYNNLENMSIRIGTIPFEDFFYNFLYMLWSILLFEYFVIKNSNNQTKIDSKENH